MALKGILLDTESIFSRLNLDWERLLSAIDRLTRRSDEASSSVAQLASQTARLLVSLSTSPAQPVRPQTTPGSAPQAPTPAPGSLGAPPAPAQTAQAPALFVGLIRQSEALSRALARLASQASRLFPTPSPAQPQTPAPGAPQAPRGPARPGGAGILANPVVQTGAVLASLGAIGGAFSALAGQIKGFVAAFNPSLIDIFNKALSDLHATVGFALAPVFQGLTDILRTVSAEFGGTLTALQPTIRQLTETFLSVLAPIIRIAADGFASLAGIIESLTPLIRLLAAAFEGMLTIVDIFHKLYLSIVSALLGAIPGFDSIEGAITQVREAFYQASRAIVTFTAWVLRFLGLSGVAERFLRSFERRPDGGRQAAPTNIALSSVEDVYRKRLVAAASAGGPTTEISRIASTTDRLSKDLANIRADVSRMDQMVEDFIQRGINEALRQGTIALEAGLKRLMQSLPGVGRFI